MDWDNPKPTFHPSHNNLQALNSKSCSRLSCKKRKIWGRWIERHLPFGSAKKPQDECSALSASRKFRPVPCPPPTFPLSNIYMHAAAWRLGTVNNYDHEYLITDAFSNLLPGGKENKETRKISPLPLISRVLLYARRLSHCGRCPRNLLKNLSVGWWEEEIEK